MTRPRAMAQDVPHLSSNFVIDGVHAVPLFIWASVGF